jgi:serine/threonine protein kinase/tetratricopeptide (TPR) repeat protein
MSEIDRPLKNLNPKLSELKSESSNAPTLDSVDGGLVSGSTQYPATGTVEQRSIGRYLLLKKLGEGGMGQVWLAQQTAPVRRQVALKLIKAGMCDETMLHRFQSERQSLAIMDHPSIAKVFDAGATPDGQPYFVMEYVPGLPITEYCDHKRLNIRERLGLFIQACEGVQHAHQKAIIHRDLKPANVLVVEVDGKPMPRIIDFGLARAATPHVSGETTFTQVGAPIGTPAYMSPEQADPEVRDVDTRTDVYSLGALLYELLTGVLPFDPKQWQNKPFDYVLRQLREEYPLRPSIQFNKKVNTHCEAAKAAADLRGTDPKRLVKLLRGDLDWITMKALEKDRGRRYGTPSELASDIGRFLQNQPVMARPPSAGYRLQKYVRRHRVGVGAAVGLVLLLTGFMVTQAVQLRRITQERDRTTRERDRANRITEFMTGMFKVSDPSEARGNAITAREVLDKASKDIDTGLAKDPELQAQMMNVMGIVYDSLGLYARAQSLFERTMDTRSRTLGPENQDTLKSMSSVGWVLQEEGKYSDAEKLQRQTLEIQRRVLGPEHPDALKSMGQLAGTLFYEGHYAEAEKLYHQALDIQRRALGPESRDTLKSMSSLAVTLVLEGHYAEAEKSLRETLEIQRRVLGSEHRNTLVSMDYLAFVLQQEGRYSEAEQLQRATLDIRRRILGPEHANTLVSMDNLANTLGYQGHFVEAEKLLRETLEIQRRVLGPEHPHTLTTMSNLAVTLAKEAKYKEATKLQRQTLEVRRRVLGPENSSTAQSIYSLASIAALQGRRDEALSLLRDAIDHGLPPSDDLGLDNDPDLKPLHNDPRFTVLVAHAKERAAAVQKAN